MKKAYAIKGYWSHSGNFSENNSWQGNILVSEDNWAEGIVSDPHSHYKGEKIIFGPCVPNQFAELSKLSPTEVSDPFVFNVKCVNGKYIGTLDVISCFGQERFGKCKIKLTALELTTEETQELENKILIARETILSGYNINYYVNISAIKKELVEFKIREHNGEKMSSYNPVALELEERIKKILDDVHSQGAKEYLEKSL